MSTKVVCDKCRKEADKPEKVLLGDLFDDDREDMGWKDLGPSCFAILKKWFGIK